jgi:hypothetical protein
MFCRLGSSGDSEGPKIATKVTTKRMDSASSGHLAATMLRPARAVPGASAAHSAVEPGEAVGRHVGRPPASFTRGSSRA